MKQLILTGVLAGALAAVTMAQGTTPSGQTGNEPKQAPKGAAGTRAQPSGKPLPAGTYQLRLTDAEATPPAAGAAPNLERWVEFVQGGQVKGREVCSIFENNDLPQTREDQQSPPKPGQAKVQMLKGNEYLRIWVNKSGNNYLLHLPPA